MTDTFLFRLFISDEPAGREEAPVQSATCIQLFNTSICVRTFQLRLNGCTVMPSLQALFHVMCWSKVIVLIFWLCCCSFCCYSATHQDEVGKWNMHRHATPLRCAPSSVVHRKSSPDFLSLPSYFTSRIHNDVVTLQSIYHTFHNGHSPLFPNINHPTKNQVRTMILKRLLAEKRTVSLTTRRDFDDRDLKWPEVTSARRWLRLLRKRWSHATIQFRGSKNLQRIDDEILMNRY